MGLTTQIYDILSRIAIGNGALIYRAVDKATTRQVALKLLVQDGDLDHRLDVDALLADSPRLRKLAGAHVCQLLDAYPDDDGPVLVYEFADGRNGQEQGEKRKLTPAEALDVAAQLISAPIRRTAEVPARRCEAVEYHVRGFARRAAIPRCARLGHRRTPQHDAG